MRTGRKILLNTGVLYVKLIITTIITLFSTRIVLDSLGIEDFGLYNLIAGVITLLAFLNSAMMASTQRFMSVTMGCGDFEELRQVFSTSLLIHILLGTAIAIILFLIEPLLFNHILSVPDSRLEAAKVSYIIMIFTTLITILGVPYNSSINSHEDMWLFAIIETIAAILKLIAAYMLYILGGDKLIIYCCFMLGISMLVVCSKLIWCHIKYEETTLKFYRYLNKIIFKKINNFVLWNSFGALSQIGRNQGVAVTLNMFFGVVVNAAYGITNQVNSLLTYFSHIMTATLSPQIMKSKGEGNIQRMIYISVLASKLSFFLSAIMAVILFIDLPLILQFWLKKVPNQSLEFCQYTIWTFLVMQLYPGLVRLIHANGEIRNYQIVTSFLLLANLPIGYFLFKIGYPPTSIFISMLIIQVLCLFTTLYFCYAAVNLNVLDYILNIIFKPITIFIVVLLLCSYLYKTFMSTSLISLFIIGIISSFLLSVFFYLIILNKQDRDIILSIIKRKSK